MCTLILLSISNYELLSLSHSSFPIEQCRVCGASCTYLPITDEVGEFTDIFCRLLSAATRNLWPDFTTHCICISDETAGNDVFQRPCEAHPVAAGAHFTGLSPLWSVVPELSSAALFNCCARMLNVRAVSQLITVWGILERLKASLKDCFRIIWESLSY